MSSGYRMDGNSKIPNRWDIINFGDVVKIRNNKVVASTVPSGTQSIDLECLEQGTGRLIKSDEAKGSGVKYSFKKGDVLFGRLRAYLKKYWLASFDGVCSTEIWPLINKNERLINKYLYLLVQTNHFSTAASVTYGTHMPRSDWNVLKELLIRVPPVPEQRAIAQALSDVDDLINSMERLIAKKRDIKQAAMQQLLTGKTRLPRFSGAWEVIRLGDIATIKTGAKDVNEGNPSGMYPFFTCSRNISFSDSYSFDTEAILIAGNGDVGNLHYYNGKFEAYQRTYVLHRFITDIKFIWHQLQYRLIDSLGIDKIGSSIPYIKMENLTGFAFSAPVSDDEKKAIAEKLSDMDLEIEILSCPSSICKCNASVF